MPGLDPKALDAPAIQRIRDLIKPDFVASARTTLLTAVSTAVTQAAAAAALLYQPKNVVAVWTAFPFAASVSDLGSGFQVCQYWKDPQGIVHLRGGLTFSGTPANPQTVGTLPAGFRPPAQEVFAIIGGAATADGEAAMRLNINVGGVVSIQSADALAWSGTFATLAGITFDSGSLP